jgi:hypothetical protein
MTLRKRDIQSAAQRAHMVRPAAVQRAHADRPAEAAATHPHPEPGSSVYEWARLQERLLSAQLAVLRKYLAERSGSRESREKRKSQINLIREILATGGHPLHISEIIQRAAEQYAVALDRESVVSAVAKKVKKGVLFERVGPNTFGLKK